MSYRRWSDSNWYIFWSGGEGHEDQLAIWHVSDEGIPYFTYKQLKPINTIDDLKTLLKLNIPDEEYEECLVSIKKWIRDMEEEKDNGSTNS